MAPPKCKVPAASKITQAIVDSIKEDALKKKDEPARVAAANKITEIVTASGVPEEPFLIQLLGVAITLAGDNKSKDVRAAADIACAGAGVIVRVSGAIVVLSCCVLREDRPLIFM